MKRNGCSYLVFPVLPIISILVMVSCNAVAQAAHVPVRLTTAAGLPSYSYSGGVITASANGALTVDGVPVAQSDRILLKDGAAGPDNGVYVVTATGGVAAPFVLTRASDCNSSMNYTQGTFIFTQQGTVNAGVAFVVATQGTITPGTTSVSWVQFLGLPPTPEELKKQADKLSNCRQKANKTTNKKTVFIDNNKASWNCIEEACSLITPMTDACVQAAVDQTSTECGNAGKFFQRTNTWWQVANLGFIVASGAFTAVGASTTISNAKVWSTLGGTTGLGAVTTTINANAGTNTAGLISVNNTLNAFALFRMTGLVPGQQAQPTTAADGKSTTIVYQLPSNFQIVTVAPIFAAECEAAATSSSK